MFVDVFASSIFSLAIRRPCEPGLLRFQFRESPERRCQFVSRHSTSIYAVADAFEDHRGIRLDADVRSVPEPQTVMLFGLGALALVCAKGRQPVRGDS